MTNLSEKDLTVVGDSTVPTGRYRKIRVMGTLRMEGEIRCISFQCMGDAISTGSFQSQKTDVMGDSEFRGPVDAGVLRVMGDATCLAGLRAREIHCMGELEVVGTLNADSAKILGNLKVSGDCNADRFESRGGFHINGLLSVDELKVVPWKPCQAGEIGGSHLRVQRRRGMLGTLWLWDEIRSALHLRHREGRLDAQTIEGDEVFLEDTTAAVVRGGNVSIGPGCQIGRVEHRGTFSHHPQSQIGEVVKV